MSSIKVNIAVTDGSYFISSPNNDLPTNVQYDPQQLSFEWGGLPYTIENYKVIPGEDIINWNAGIELAYRYICLFPNKVIGYPDLGTQTSLSANFLLYLAIDGQKSMARIIEKLSLSDTAVADFSLIYAWSEAAASLNTASFKEIVGALTVAANQAEADAEVKATECAEAVSLGNTYTWPTVEDSEKNVLFESTICATAECCSETKDAYYQLAKQQQESEVIFSDAGISADDITKKHIYKFVQSGGPS
jgi:hypothetical protein